jgi:hypothetical protein
MNLSTSGPSVHDVYTVYDVLFSHLKDMMERMEKKKASWKRHLVKALQAASDKLKKYYQRTYQAEGYVYAIATILNPSQKLSTFQKGSWAEQEINWHDKYAGTFHELFHFYCLLHPDATTPSTQPKQKEGLQRAIFELQKHKQKQPSQPDQLYPELETYLREGKISC